MKKPWPRDQEIFGERFGRRGLNWSVDQLDLDSLRLDNISLSPLDLFLGQFKEPEKEPDNEKVPYGQAIFKVP
jgi:hypothetical protein